MTDEHSSQPVLTGNIFTVLHILEHQTADWILTARNGNYKLMIKWKASHVAEKRTENTGQKRKSSRARSARNNRRLRAFLDNKSARENGNTASADNIEVDVTTEVDTTTTQHIESETPATSIESNSETETPSEDENDLEDLDISTHTTEDQAVMDRPTARESKDDRLPSPPNITAITSQKDPACPEGRPKTGGTRTERHKRIGVEKVALDRPQQMYLFKIKGENRYLLADEEKLEQRGEIREEKNNKDFYKSVTRSFEHWMDIRNTTNFLYSEKRANDVKQIAKQHNLELFSYK